MVSANPHPTSFMAERTTGSAGSAGSAERRLGFFLPYSEITFAQLFGLRESRLEFVASR